VEEEKLNTALRKLVKGLIPKHSFVGVVKFVDESEFTCDVEPVDGGAVRHTVRLKPAIDQDGYGVIPIPELNSDVIVSIIGNNENHCYVSIVGKVKKYLIKLENATIVLSSEGVIINGDGFGGIVKVNELRSDLAKITTLLKSIQETFQSWIPVAGDGGAALKAAASSFISNPIPDFSTIENERVKHGG
jgi:hypothetical protein